MALKKYNQKGFLLAEALIAAAMISIILTALFGLQMRSFSAIVRWHRKISRVLVAKKVVAHHMGSPEEIIAQEEQAVQDMLPITKLSYEATDVSGNGQFQKSFRLYQLRSIASWSDSAGKQEETVVGFVFKPVKKEKGKL